MRSWSLLFLLTLVACVGVFGYAAIEPTWWMTRNASMSGDLALGAQVDHLLLVILGITGGVFVLTQVVLVWVLWRYRASRAPRATYSHGHIGMEVAWTLVPAAILVFLAFYQFGGWQKIKFRDAAPRAPMLAEVTGRQFYWAVRYPGADGKMGTADDLHTTNDLHMIKGEATTIELRSSDVLHSFFLPDMRIKQDAVPGLAIPVWFDVDEAGTYELVCAELCGWGHTRMRAIVTVHATRAEYEEWFRGALAEQRRSQLSDSEAAAPDGEAGE